MFYGKKRKLSAELAQRLVKIKEEYLLIMG